MTRPAIPQAPLLGHVEGVDLVDTGEWWCSTGLFTATAEHLACAVAALECPAVRRPVLKAGHSGAFGVGDPALGYVANLRLDNEGQTLVGDYRGMPAWLTEVDSNGESVLSSAYPDRSVECEHNYVCALGHNHTFVVHAVSWLGVERPAVGTLESLIDLYGVVAATSPSTHGELVTLTSRQESTVPQQISASATTDDVRRAYYSTPEGSGWSMWIREMYVDPMELIVDDDSNGEIVRVPYQVAADGTVTFGDAQTVKVTYVAARTGATAPVASFATRAESRALLAAPPAPPAPSATPVEGSPTPPEGAGMTPEQLRETLGLAADASQIEVAAALAAAGHIPAVEPAPAEPAVTVEPPAPAVEPVPEPVAAAAGETVSLDRETYNRLSAQAAAGEEARQQQLRERREGLVAAAVGDGRIPPSRREAWIAQLTADPGAETVLASLAKGTVPVSENGLAGEGDGENTAASAAAVRETPAYKNWSHQ